MRTVVVLARPVRAEQPEHRCRTGISRSTPSSARVEPKAFTRPSALTAGPALSLDSNIDAGIAALSLGLGDRMTGIRSKAARNATTGER